MRGNTALESELFPLVLEMDECPVPHESRASLRFVSLIDPGSGLWRAGSEWAEGEAQQAVLDELKALTDPDARVMLSLPIGAEGLDESWVEAGLLVELGPEGLLTPLDPVYLERLHAVHALAVLDAKRLIDAGESEAGLMRMVDLIRFYRLVRARPTVEEQLASQELMAIAAEQLRDIVWYFSDREAFESPAALTAAVDALGEEKLNLQRVRWPSVPEIAAQQLVSRCYVPQGGVRPDEFALAMSRIEAAEGDDPLRLFGEAARFRLEAGRQRDYFDVTEMLGEVFGNYELRWQWDINDEDLAELPSRHDTMDPLSYRVIDAAARGLQKLVPYRRAALVHLSGTRLALGIVAYRIARDGDQPRILPNLQPRFVDDIDKNLDLFGYDYDSQRNADFLYFVPASEESMPPNISPRNRYLYEQPHVIRLDYQLRMDDLLGAGVRGAVDYTDLAAERGEEAPLAVGPPAEFEIGWFTLDEDGNRGGTAFEGAPPPPLTFTNARAEQFNVQDRRGEILVILPSTGDQDGTFTPRQREIFTRIGFRYHFDGVRVVLIGGDYAEENLTDTELRLLAARAARQIGVVDVHFWSETQGEPERFEIDDDSDPTFIVDRNGIVRAAGVQYRFLERAVLELIEEQPVNAMLPETRTPSGLAFELQTIETVGPDGFVLYSRGKNLRDDREFLQPHVFDSTGRELLFWPPALSLQRR